MGTAKVQRQIGSVEFLRQGLETLRIPKVLKGNEMNGVRH